LPLLVFPFKFHILDYFSILSLHFPLFSIYFRPFPFHWGGGGGYPFTDAEGIGSTVGTLGHSKKESDLKKVLYLSLYSPEQAGEEEEVEPAGGEEDPAGD
jgi:hypothetical protein